MSKRASHIWWGSILLIHLLFLGYQLVHQRLYLKDSGEYLQAADNLMHAATLYSGDLSEPLRYDHYSKRPPVYPLFIGLIRTLFGQDIWIAVFQTGLSLLNFWLLQRLLAFLGLWSGKCLWLLPFVLLYPAQYIYANLVMTEILFQSLLLAALLMLLKAQKSKQSGPVWGYTLLLVMAMFTKPVMHLFVWPHLLLLLYAAWKWKKTSLLLPALLPLMLSLGFQYRNQLRTGHFHFSSIQNKSLLQYTTYHLLLRQQGPEQARITTDSIQSLANAQPTFAQSEGLIQRACVQLIGRHLPAYLGLHLRGMLNFFLDPGRFDLYHFFGLSHEQEAGLLYHFGQQGYRGVWKYLSQQPAGVLLLLLLVATLNGLKLLALLWFPFNKQLSRAQKVLILLLLLYLAGLTGINGASRFAVPVFPLMLLVLAAAIHAFPIPISMGFSRLTSLRQK
ncbi:MAG: hypothetical protein D6730_24295 [Bacteroidetes bacterium]|nr:MAG: hypothetical protein D6730_24295 [Bacteroidota bacterium]